MPFALKPRLLKIAQITAKTALGLIAFVFLVVLSCVILNTFDAPLSEQAKALLAPPANPYPSDENLYLAMAGLEGAGPQSIIDMGRARIEAYNQALDSMLLNPENALRLSKEWDAAKLTFSGKLEIGHPRTTSIWKDAKSHRQNIAALLASNQALYQRYLSMHRLNGYYETARPSFMSPLAVVSPPLRTLFLGDVANRVQTGSLEQQREALDDMRLDLQMWKTVLNGDGTLISKMLAAASLHSDLILIGDLVTDPSSDLARLGDVLDPLLLPFDLKDYRIGNAFAAEFRGTAALYNSITFANEYAASAAPSPSWRQRTWSAFQAHFFKIHATENLGAAYAAQWVALGDSEPSRFHANQEGYREWLEQNQLHLSPAYIYNPMGKILARLAMSQNDTYLLRVFDVAAYQRLVYLVFQLKRQHIAAPEVAPYLLAHHEWSVHPFGGTPFRWNAETRVLAVNTVGEHPTDQRFSVTLR